MRERFQSLQEKYRNPKRKVILIEAAANKNWHLVAGGSPENPVERFRLNGYISKGWEHRLMKRAVPQFVVECEREEEPSRGDYLSRVVF